MLSPKFAACIIRRFASRRTAHLHALHSLTERSQLGDANLNNRMRDQRIDDMVQLQRAALAAIPQHPTAQSFLDWAREELPKQFPEMFRDRASTPEENSRFAYWLARDLWNGVPLPTNRFRPKPLPRPKRNDVCPCGSGLKFKNCCSGVPPTDWPRDVLWPLFAHSQPVEYWLQVARQLPAVGVLYVGERFREEERWEALVDLLEPRFAPGQNPSSQLVGPLQWLCSAYDALHRTTEKKDALLARLCASANGHIRGIAYLRLAATRHDRGDRETAWRAWRQADKALPGDPDVALIELTMLTAENQTDRVMQRVDFWLARLANDPEVGEESLDAIRSFKVNPYRAMRLAGQEEADLLSAPDAARLFDWLDAACERPLPQLKWRAMASVEDDRELRGGHTPLLSAAGKSLERRWHKRSGMNKPFSIDYSSGDELQALTDLADWLPWLEGHPQAADSLSILDDLATLLLNGQDAVDADLFHFEALVVRAVAMLEKHWPETRAGTLPWAVEENRPALRLLAHGVDIADWGDGTEEDYKTACVRLYLRLNPNDNHAFRTVFVDRLLVQQQNAEALAVAEAYPDDMFAETTYGRVLALYRLGRLDEAETALGQALEHLPLPADYLLADHPAEPEEDPAAHEGLTIGSEQQAWLYRSDMRDEWLATKGALDWLRARR